MFPSCELLKWAALWNSQSEQSSTLSSTVKQPIRAELNIERHWSNWSNMFTKRFEIVCESVWFLDSSQMHWIICSGFWCDMRKPNVKMSCIVCQWQSSSLLHVQLVSDSVLEVKIIYISSCSSVVEHCVRSAEVVGSIPRDHLLIKKMYNLNVL